MIEIISTNGLDFVNILVIKTKMPNCITSDPFNPAKIVLNTFAL